MPERRCGTCTDAFAGWLIADEPNELRCLCPEALWGMLVDESDGTTCPCYRSREERSETDE